MTGEAEKKTERLRKDVDAETTDLRRAAVKEADRLIAEATSRKARRHSRKEANNESSKPAPDATTDAEPVEIDLTDDENIDITTPRAAAADDTAEESLIDDLRDAWTAPED